VPPRALRDLSGIVTPVPPSGAWVMYLTLRNLAWPLWVLFWGILFLLVLAFSSSFPQP
jgi:hypothetical protein